MVAKFEEQCQPTLPPKNDDPVVEVTTLCYDMMERMAVAVEELQDVAATLARTVTMLKYELDIVDKIKRRE